MKKDLLIEKLNAFISNLFPETEQKPEEVALEETKTEMIQQTLEDGTIISAESIAVDQPVFKVTEEGDVPLEDGTYMLPELKVEIIVEGGIVTKITENEEKEEDEIVEVIPVEEMKAQLRSEIENEIKAKYEKEIIDLKTSIKDELTKLAKETSKSSLVQAPEVDKTPAKPLTKKDLILREIEQKIKEKNN